MFKLFGKHKDFGSSLFDDRQRKRISNLNRKVDEDIFTDLAPEIEELVLAEGVDEGLVQRVYPVKFPKYGDKCKETYTVRKYVKVLVQDMD